MLNNKFLIENHESFELRQTSLNISEHKRTKHKTKEATKNHPEDCLKETKHFQRSLSVFTEKLISHERRLFLFLFLYDNFL